MLKANVITLGCKVNQYESEIYIQELMDRNIGITDGYNADYFIINTCSVTNESDKKSKRIVRRIRKNNKNAIIAVVGCFVEGKDDLDIDANIILGNKDKKDVVKYLVNSDINTKIIKASSVFEVKFHEDKTLKETYDKTRAFIKIQDGCNQYCSFCIIPYVRGNIRSKNKDLIISEISELSKKGYKEFVLTGIHIASFNNGGNYKLIDLLEDIDKLEYVERVRVSSLEIGIIDEDFAKRYSKLKKAANHFHLSLQSGCDAVLRRMNRKYTTEEFYNKVMILRSFVRNSQLTTDVIVGFVQETDEEFETTVEFLKKIRFSKVHLFKYSKRKGTKAYQMVGHIDERIKKDRMRKISKILEKIEEEINYESIGNTTNVLIEENKDGFMSGYSNNYQKIYIPLRNNLLNNIMVSVKIVDYKDGKLIAREV